VVVKICATLPGERLAAREGGLFLERGSKLDLYSQKPTLVEAADVTLSYTPDDKHCSEKQHRWYHVGEHIEHERVDTSDGGVPNGVNGRKCNRTCG